MSSSLALTRAEAALDSATRSTLPAMRRRDFIVRAAVSHFMARVDKDFRSPEDAARKLYPHDEATPALIRAATAPADTTTVGWADTLVQTAVADFIGGLAGISAAARLMAAGLMVDFGRNGVVVIPSVATAAGDAGGWVQQGAPIPVRELTLGSLTLTPRKIGTISVFSATLAQASGGAIEKVVRQVLREASALALDTYLFDAVAGDATRPAGLLFGVAPIAATAGGTVEAMVTDLNNLAAAVAPVAGGGPIMFIANPEQANAIALRQGGSFAYTVAGSSALAAGTVVAIAPSTFVSAFGPEPRFDLSDQATLHFEDATPLDIGTAGAPPTVAAPVRSLYQQDLIAVRMLLQASWGLRAATGVAVVTGASW